MKKAKYLTFAIVSVFLLVYLYQNYIYYKIPYNPITDYSSENPIGFYITKNLPAGEQISTKTHDMDTSKEILKYFSNLNLVPLKNKEAENLNSMSKRETYFTGMFKINQSDNLFFGDIFIDNLSVIHISSDIPGIKRGYYKIVESKFDYTYIYDLISNSNR